MLFFWQDMQLELFGLVPTGAKKASLYFAVRLSCWESRHVILRKGKRFLNLKKPCLNKVIQRCWIENSGIHLDEFFLCSSHIL